MASGWRYDNVAPQVVGELMGPNDSGNDRSRVDADPQADPQSGERGGLHTVTGPQREIARCPRDRHCGSGGRGCRGVIGTSVLENVRGVCRVLLRRCQPINERRWPLLGQDREDEVVHLLGIRVPDVVDLVAHVDPGAV